MARPEFADLERAVRAALEEARRSLGRIEEHVRARGETPPVMATSRLLAQFCMHARDYLGSASYGKPEPRRLAVKLREIHTGLVTHRAATDPLGLRPSPEEVEALALAAEAAPVRL